MAGLDELARRLVEVNHASQLKPIVGALIREVADLQMRVEYGSEARVEKVSDDVTVVRTDSRPVKKATPKKATE